LFDDFGGSGLNFNVRVWNSGYVNNQKKLKSQLYNKLSRFNGENI
jgi:hypothetical protein